MLSDPVGTPRAPDVPASHRVCLDLISSQLSYRVIKIFFEHADESLLNDMAQFPIYADFVGLVADRQTEQVRPAAGGVMVCFSPWGAGKRACVERCTQIR